MPALFRKDIIPHLIGIAIFYLLVVFYFSPMVFDGKVLFQNDILQWEGSAKEVLDYRAETGEQALWTNRMFGGMPTYLISMEFPGDITNVLIKILTLGLPHPINSLFFGMVGMYILLLSFKVRPEIAVLAAVAFAFNTFHILSLEAGHNAKIWAICLIPLIFAGIHLAFSGKKILGLALFTLALMLQLKFNHLQITYYTVLMVGIYGLTQLIQYYQNKRLVTFGRIFGVLLIGLVLTIAANLGRLATVYEYGAYSIRGASNLPELSQKGSGLDKDYAFAWSNGVLETMTLLVPDFYGGGSRESLPKNSASEAALRANGVEAAQIRGFVDGAPTYWGNQPFTGGPIYGGAVMVFLFVLGVLFAPKPYRWAFLAITILSLMLSWGKNMAWFNYMLFDILPGYNKFRAVSMALCMALFAIPVLGALGLENFFTRIANSEAKKSLLIAFGVAGGLALLLFLFGGVFGFRGAADSNLPDWLVDALRDDRKSMLKSSAIRSFIFILLGASLLFAVLKNKVSAQLASLGLLLLIGIDLWSFNKRYLYADKFSFSPAQEYFRPTPADEKVLRDRNHFRVFNLENPFNEARTSYRFNSIGGYHGAKMGRYQELIDEVMSQEINDFIQKAQEGNFDFQSLRTLNMLNTKYILAGKTENAVLENPMANGPAWFPFKIIEVASNEEEIRKLPEINSQMEATVNTLEFGDVNPGEGDIVLSEYLPDRLNYTVNASKAGLAVFSEIYYPKGWKAFVNGNETEIIRVNYLLRGVNLPEGNSVVEFRFEPSSYYNTKNIMVFSQYLILGLLIFGTWYSIKKQAHGGERKDR
ncbi:YfhO family protein [Pararhodonellum marinum]|uniref:YfhO family protein n=1 Tax=Pararhodonellum marinum TaxID=2755358 RepID=UPI00188DD37A|nr:YfhO family protein [Pararhodonellum marinum]